MSSEMYARIRENPKFKELVSKRERLAWTLTGIVLVLFFGLFLTVAFNPAVLAIKLGDSYVTTGLLIGLIQFIFFWILTAVYVRRANSEFDVLTADLLRESSKEKNNTKDSCQTGLWPRRLRDQRRRAGRPGHGNDPETAAQHPCHCDVCHFCGHDAGHYLLGGQPH